jgi:hypothetical protein
MDITAAQRENRRYFVGGFYGQLVSGVLWLIAASLATWSTPRAAITTLLVSGFFIFPLTVFLIRVTRGPRGDGVHNPLNALGMQVALVLPFSMTVLLGVGRYRLDWIFPATTILVGAHYLPFAFLYGMRVFIALAAALIAGGVAIVMLGISGFSTDAWYTAAVLIAFAFVLRAIVRQEAG